MAKPADILLGERPFFPSAHGGRDQPVPGPSGVRPPSPDAFDGQAPASATATAGARPSPQPPAAAAASAGSKGKGKGRATDGDGHGPPPASTSGSSTAAAVGPITATVMQDLPAGSLQVDYAKWEHPKDGVVVIPVTYTSGTQTLQLHVAITRHSNLRKEDYETGGAEGERQRAQLESLLKNLVELSLTQRHVAPNGAWQVSLALDSGNKVTRAVMRVDVADAGQARQITLFDTNDDANRHLHAIDLGKHWRQNGKGFTWGERIDELARQLRLVVKGESEVLLSGAPNDARDAAARTDRQADERRRADLAAQAQRAEDEQGERAEPSA